MKPRVLLAATTRWVPTARLAMALAKAGFAVEAICPSQHPIGRTGSAGKIHAYHDLAPIQSFTKAIAAAKPDLIIPGDDLATQHLHEVYRRRKRSGNDSVSVCALIERSLGAPESFSVVYARSRLMKIAREAGVRAPETTVLLNLEDLRSWIATSGLPTALKTDGSCGGTGVRIVSTSEGAERAFMALARPPLMARALKRAFIDGDATLVRPALFRRRPAVNAQAFVAGREATSTVACWDGNVLAALHFEVLNKMGSTGHASVLRWVEDAEMASATEKIVRRLRLSGLHGFDFMREAATGNTHLIEVNPRPTQVGHLAFGPGRDLPAALYSAVTGQAGSATRVVTEKDTVALFPQEWIRDSASPFLRSAYHDVPWEEPELVQACIRSSREQRAWYSPSGESKRLADLFSRAPKAAEGSGHAALAAQQSKS